MMTHPTPTTEKRRKETSESAKDVLEIEARTYTILLSTTFAAQLDLLTSRSG